MLYKCNLTPENRMLKYLKKERINKFRIIARINKPEVLSSGIFANHLARK
jgi:hypothetical protein